MIIEFAKCIYTQIISISQPLLKGGEYWLYLRYGETGGSIDTESFETEEQAWKRYNEIKTNLINSK